MGESRVQAYKILLITKSSIYGIPKYAKLCARPTMYYSVKPVVPTLGVISQGKPFGNVWRLFWLSRSGDVTNIEWVEIRHAAKFQRCIRQCPTAKNFLAQNVNSAKVREALHYTVPITLECRRSQPHVIDVENWELEGPTKPKSYHQHLNWVCLPPFIPHIYIVSRMEVTSSFHK